MGKPSEHGHVHLHHHGPQRERHHEHSWHLADGTGLHAPPGVLLRDPETGDVCCHVCGEHFTSLGSHVRVHGYTAAEYRRTMGLGRTTALTSTRLSTGIAVRQRQRYDTSVELRSAFAHGQGLARRGVLNQLARSSVTGVRPESARRRAESLERGRATRARRRGAALADLLASAGHADLAAFLRARYADGASLAALADETGLGRDRLRAALTGARIDVRAPGRNTPLGKQARASRADEVVAARLGTTDLPGWLLDRRAGGATLVELARLTGHSSHWVRWRIEAAERRAAVGDRGSAGTRR